VDDAGEDEEMEIDNDNDNDNDAAMDVDGDDLPSFFGAAKNPDEGTLSTGKKGSLKKTRVALLVKEKIRKVLEQTELVESRSAKLHENDFRKYLAVNFLLTSFEDIRTHLRIITTWGSLCHSQTPPYTPT
jgi:18S rRNA (adenine1779-N6/adenine1780-N6)-dimethyltransferase